WNMYAYSLGLLPYPLNLVFFYNRLQNKGLKKKMWAEGLSFTLVTICVPSITVSGFCR
uniref:Uncharacterized protein n=1 Tax=Meleagris gallopavo TaxID=9103 RepID=A0A803YAG7_MELGA